MRLIQVGDRNFDEALGKRGMSKIKSNILGAILALFSSIALFRLVAFVFSKIMLRSWRHPSVLRQDILSGRLFKVVC